MTLNFERILDRILEIQIKILKVECFLIFFLSGSIFLYHYFSGTLNVLHNHIVATGYFMGVL